MKISKTRLKEIIKEELSKISEAGAALPKRKPEHVDYDEGHDDGLAFGLGERQEARQQNRSKAYNDGYDDGLSTAEEFKRGMRGRK